MNTTKVDVKGMSEFFDEQSPVIKAALPDTYIWYLHFTYTNLYSYLITRQKLDEN